MSSLISKSSLREMRIYRTKQTPFKEERSIIILRTICVLVAFLIFNSVTAQKKSVDPGIPQDLEQISGAETIIRFQKFIANDQQRLIQMKSRSEQLVREIEALTKQFNNLDTQRRDRIYSVFTFRFGRSERPGGYIAFIPPRPGPEGN